MSKKKENKPEINRTKRFLFILVLVIFIPLAVYLLTTRQNLAFFMVAIATLILIQVLNRAFKSR